MMAFVLESGRDVLDEVLTMYSDNWALAPCDHKALLRAVRQARETVCLSGGNAEIATYITIPAGPASPKPMRWQNESKLRRGNDRRT